MVSLNQYLKIIFIIVGLTWSFSANAQLEELGAANSRLYYSGNLGASEKIELNIQLTGYKVSGSYMSINSGDLFIINGRMSIDKSGIGVLVFDSENNYIASIEAKIISGELDFAREIKGVWKSADGTVRKDLNLSKIAEFARNNSQMLLSSIKEERLAIQNNKPL